jgi:MFS family permease
MTSLSTDPMAVSLVQVATSLPMFLFTLPAGALSDIIDTRRFLIVIEVAIVIVSAIFAAMVSFALVTPVSLLLTTALLSAGISLCTPALLAITPLLAPRKHLDSAIAANSVIYNISRAAGPALGGVIIAGLGIAAPFWIFGASTIGIIAALLWWRPPRRSAESLPTERLISAVRTGVRHVAHNRHLRATLIRALAFFPFASAYGALLPLVARNQMDQGPELYGVLLAALSGGSMAGSFALNGLKARLGPDRAVASGILATAFALILFGLAHTPLVAICACVVAGASWTIVLTSLYVSAQLALPDWVRGRGLAILLTTVFGAMTVGSAFWGHIAGVEGLEFTHFAAAAAVTLAIPLTWRWKLQTAASIDLTPSRHWVPPANMRGVENDEGPVLVSVEYRVDANCREAFLDDLDELGHERKRDGAYAWGLFEDTADPGRFVETFLIETWLELRHLRERVTKADRLLEEHIRRLLKGAPHVTLLTASREAGHPR